MGSPKELFKVVLGRKQGPQRNQALVLFRMGCQSEGMCRLYAAWRHPMRSHCRTRRIPLLYPCYTLGFRSLLGALVPSLYCFLPFFFHSPARHAGLHCRLCLLRSDIIRTSAPQSRPHIVHFSRIIARGIYWCVIIGVLCIRGPHRALPAWGGFRYLRCRVCHDGFALAVKSASLSVHSVQILSVHQFFLVIFCI